MISTPIGNLGDITLRALETFRQVDALYCEDTRVTKKLLGHLNLPQKPLFRYDDVKGEKQRPEIFEKVRQGQALGIVCDAGTPLLSDPGFKLVREAILEGIPVSPIPGISSIPVALTVAALPPYPFTFHGFLPNQKGAQAQFVKQLSDWPTTHVIFERASRVQQTLALFQTYMPQARVAICRELTKIYEEVIRGEIQDVLTQLSQRDPLKGEVVLVIHQEHLTHLSPDTLKTFLKDCLVQESVKTCVAQAVTELGASKGEAYKMALNLREGKYE